MKKIKLRNIALVAAFICLASAMSTSDYYTLELHQPEPASVWWLVGIGIALTLPAAFHLLTEKNK